jgi:hypothetical protein
MRWQKTERKLLLIFRRALSAGLWARQYLLGQHLSYGKGTDKIAIAFTPLKDFIRHHMIQANNN